MDVFSVRRRRPEPEVADPMTLIGEALDRLSKIDVTTAPHTRAQACVVLARAHLVDALQSIAKQAPR